MHVPPVLLNNTPLVALFLINQLALLRDLFGVVWIPVAVEQEFLAVDSAIRQQALQESPWLQVVTLQNPRHALVYTGLDEDEAEVLGLAVEHDARLIIMDERKGRRYAQRLAIPLTGTLGVLLSAKERGLLTQIAPLIVELQAAGLYLHSALVTKTLVLAHEI